MPYIKATIGKKLSEEQIGEVYDVLKEPIELIPGKTMYNAMMEVCPDRLFFMGGERGEFAYIDVRLFGPAPAEAKEAYTAAVCRGLEEKLGIPPKNVYVTYLELPGWGVEGHFIGK